MIQSRRIACVLLVLAAITVDAQAAEPDRVREASGITFVSGGIGADSREDLAAREKSYNFKLVMTLEGSGTFVSDALVTLTGANGRKLVEHVAEGPLFLAGLPAGTYVVSAKFRDQTHTRKFQLRADRLHTEYMRWPAQPDLDVTLPRETK